jgi:hypothetical protein
MTCGESRSGPQAGEGWPFVSRTLVPVLCLLALTLGGCSEESPPATIVDLTPPGAIGDLVAVDTSDSSVTLEWSAPADDADQGGPVAFYDLRYRFGNLDVGVWALADSALGEPSPAQPGASQRFEVRGLLPDTLYAFGIISFDDAGLSSVLSNIGYGRTLVAPVPPDSVRPAAVTDLAVTDIGPSSVRLSWTATGDDSLTGRAFAYDVRYRVGTLGDSTWLGASQAEDEPNPVPPGSPEAFLVTNLRSETSYAFGLRVRDEGGNVSALSNVVTATTPVRPPDFLDPRGIDVLPNVGGEQYVFVTDHGDGVIYRFTVGGTRRPIGSVRGVCGVTRGAGAGIHTFLIAGDEGEDTGEVWRFGGSTAQPLLLYRRLGFPSDIAVYPAGDFSGYLLVGESSGGRILRMRPAATPGPDSLVLARVTDGEVAGVAVDGDGVAYFGVRTAAGSSIRRLVGSGTPTLFHDLGAMGVVGDLRLDPRGNAIWYLDLCRSAAIRVNLRTARVDTLATRLRRPVSIAPGSADSLLTYSSADGYVLAVERRR